MGGIDDLRVVLAAKDTTHLEHNFYATDGDSRKTFPIFSVGLHFITPKGRNQ
jgi:hypothetical protein